MIFHCGSSCSMQPFYFYVTLWTVTKPRYNKNHFVYTNTKMICLKKRHFFGAEKLFLFIYLIHHLQLNKI